MTWQFAPELIAYLLQHCQRHGTPPRAKRKGELFNPSELFNDDD